MFQLRRDMAMRRINVAELAFTIGRLIAQPFQMLRLGVGDALGLLLPLGQRLFIDIELDRRESLEKRVDHPRIDRIGRNILTHRSPILLPQVVTDVAGPTLILDYHLVAAFPAIDKSVQEGFARAWDPTGFVSIILGVIVFEHDLNLRVGFPTDVGWVDVQDADAPLVLRQAGERGTSLAGLVADGAGAAVGESAGIGRMLQNRQYGRHPRGLPDQIAKAIPPG